MHNLGRIPPKVWVALFLLAAGVTILAIAARSV